MCRLRPKIHIQTKYTVSASNIYVKKSTVSVLLCAFLSFVVIHTVCVYMYVYIKMEDRRYIYIYIKGISVSQLQLTTGHKFKSATDTQSVMRWTQDTWDEGNARVCHSAWGIYCKASLNNAHETTNPVSHKDCPPLRVALELLPVSWNDWRRRLSSQRGPGSTLQTCDTVMFL